MPCLRISGTLAGAGGEYNLGVVVFGGWEHPGLTAPPELSQVLPCARETQSPPQHPRLVFLALGDSSAPQIVQLANEV